MVQSYVTAYVVAWTLTTLVAQLSGRRLTAFGDGVDHRLLTAIFAGALWPLLVLGVLEAGMVSTIGLVQASRRPSPAPAWETADIVSLP